MLQLIFMFLGIVYLFKLIGLGNASTKMVLPPEALADWRHQRSHQYVWGIIAGWGSFVVSFVVAKATMDPDGYYTQSDALAAAIPSLLIGIAILVVGIVFSMGAGRKAKAIEQQNAVSPFGTPS